MYSITPTSLTFSQVGNSLDFAITPVNADEGTHSFTVEATGFTGVLLAQKVSTTFSVTFYGFDGTFKIPGP